MLGSLFDRCMKRRGVKESDPYDWEKTDVQQTQQTAQQVQLQTSVHQAISGATNNVNNNAASANLHQHHHHNHTANNNNNLVQTTSLVNPVVSATGGGGAAATGGSLGHVPSGGGSGAPTVPISVMNNGTANALADQPKSTAAKPKESAAQPRTMLDWVAKDNNNGEPNSAPNVQRVNSTASAAAAYFTSTTGVGSEEKKESGTTGTMVTAGLGVSGKQEGIDTHNHPASANTGSSGPGKDPIRSVFRMEGKVTDRDGNTPVDISNTDNSHVLAGLTTNKPPGVVKGLPNTTGNLKSQQQQQSEPIVSMKGLSLCFAPGKPAGATPQPHDVPELVVSTGTSARDGTPPKLASAVPHSIFNADNRATVALNQAQQQYQSARATSGILHAPVDVKRRQLVGASGAMTTGRLRVLTAPPISCQDLAREVEKKSSAGGADALGGGHLGNSKRQLRSGTSSGGRGTASDEKRNSSSIGGTANNSRVSNSSRDSKLMNAASGEHRGSAGGGGGDSDRVGDHSMTQFALIDDDNVSQQVTRGGGCGGHTLASQWKSQFDDSEETTDNEWRQEPQSPDICVSRGEGNLRSSSHHHHTQSVAGAISKRRSKSGVSGGVRREPQSQQQQLQQEMRMIVAAESGGGGLQKSASSHQLHCCVHDDTDANNNAGEGRALVLTNDCSGAGGGVGAVGGGYMGEQGGGGNTGGLILNQLSDHKKEKVKKRLERTRSTNRSRSTAAGAVSRIEMGLRQRFGNIKRQSSQNGAHLYIQGMENYEHYDMLPPCWSEPALNAAHLRFGLEPPFLQQAAFDDHVYHIDIKRNVCVCRTDGQQLYDVDVNAKYKSCPNLTYVGVAAESTNKNKNSVTVSATVGGVQHNLDVNDEDEVDSGAPISGKLEIRVLKSPQPMAMHSTVKIVGEQLKKTAAREEPEDQCQSGGGKKKEHRLSRIPVALAQTPGGGDGVQLSHTPPLEDLTPGLRRRRRRENTEDKYVKDVDAELNLRYARRSRNLDDEGVTSVVVAGGDRASMR